MSGYHILKSLGDDQVSMLVQLGYLRQTVRRNVAIYETYLDYLEKGHPKMDAATFTADDFNISDRHVFRVVRSFAEDIRVV